MQKEEKGKGTLVSIITVCYNSKDTIERTIESVVNQTYADIEYLIIDGKSSDGTVEIIKEWSAKNSNIIWRSEADKGIYDAMNKGISMAHGDIIGIINSDDWYERDAVETVIQTYYDNGCRPAVYYGMLGIYQNNMIKSCLFYSHNFLPETMINHPACFVEKSIYKDYGVFDITYRAVADYDFMLRLYFADKDKLFIPIDKKLANFSTGGVSGTLPSIQETDEVLCKYGIMPQKQMKRRKIVRKLKRLLHYS